MKRRIVAPMLVGSLVASGSQAVETYTIGVLAKRGAVKALQHWKATGEYLSSKINGKTFEIVPAEARLMDNYVKDIVKLTY